MVDRAVRDRIARHRPLDRGGVGAAGGGALRLVGGAIVEQPCAHLVIGRGHRDTRHQRVDPARGVECRGKLGPRGRARGQAHDFLGARPGELNRAFHLQRDDRRLHRDAVVEAGVERPARHHRE